MIDRAAPPSPSRATAWVAVCLAAGIAAGWAWLAAGVAAVLASGDAAALGPGMELFARLPFADGLPPEVWAGLQALCLPSGTAGTDTFAPALAMWLAMVLAMMLPAAAPALARAPGAAPPGTALRLVGGYLAVWTGFALAAALAQSALTAARMLTPAMAPASLVLSGTTLAAAGLYQFTPWKRACLARCRLPMLPEASAGGWFRAGLAAGRDALGCCWALMAAMFAVGVMNVVWIVLLGTVMVLERRATGHAASRAVGIGLLLWGGALLAASPAGLRLLGLG